MVIKSIISTALTCMAVISFNVSASIINPNFDDGLTGWNTTTSGSFGISVSSSAYMWSHTSCANNDCGSFSFTSGDYISINQSFDMSYVDTITFDAELSQAPFNGSSTYQSFMEAAVYIDSTEVWSSQVLGTSLISIDTTLLSGVHMLDFRIQAIGNGIDIQSDHLVIDNIAISPASAVPVPTAVWLFGSGLIGLIGFAKHKKA